MSYTETMRARTETAFIALHRGVDELHFTEFPDYNNCGDSAIALGQAAFWHSQGITVRSASNLGSIPESVHDSRIPVLINGGGNLGGLYHDLSEVRYRLAERLPADTLLIQAPQSITFRDAAAREELHRRFTSRPALRVAVRDTASFAALAPVVDDLLLAPDAVHLLGAIDAPEPVRSRIVLARNDGESAGALAGMESVDWPMDPLDLRAHEWLAWRARSVPTLKRLFSNDPDRALRRAQRRFRVGVELLAQAETIVTDRLHAMLIGLQMGRRVIALDNNNRKLSNYAETWFGDTQPRLTFERAGQALRS